MQHNVEGKSCYVNDGVNVPTKNVALIIIVMIIVVVVIAVVLKVLPPNIQISLLHGSLPDKQTKNVMLYLHNRYLNVNGDIVFCTNNATPL